MKKRRNKKTKKVGGHILSKTEENMLNFIFGLIHIGIFFTLCFLLIGSFV